MYTSHSCCAQVHPLHEHGKVQAARKASVKAQMYAARAFVAAFLTVLAVIVLFLAALIMLLCVAIDWQKTH